MNTPNKMTLLRVVLVPVFMAFMMIDSAAWHLAALGVFVLASVTDWLDGWLARKNHQITNFGKFMDPLADKALTTAAFICLMHYGFASPWALMLILFREFMVAGVRMAAVGEGNVIAASMWGKVKTVAQMAVIIVSILLMSIRAVPQETAAFVSNVLIWISTALTLISGIDYVVKNRQCLKME